MQGALEEDESPLLLDLLRGVAQNLAVKGFTRVRVCFNSMPLALAARRLMTMNPFILRLDALGVSGLADDDELVLLIRPNNALIWNKVRYYSLHTHHTHKVRSGYRGHTQQQ
jgi:hypothetical protein